MATAPLYTGAGERSGDVDLVDSLFGLEFRGDLVHQAIETELWNRRQGTSKTKDRSEVRGGGRKPFRQKGTGRARQGSTRSPHQRHGGVAHGPAPRDFRKSMPQKMRNLAFRSALSLRASAGGVRVLEGVELAEISTRNLVTFLGKLDPGRKTVFVLSERDEKLALSARNLQSVRVIVLPGLSTREVFQADTLVFTSAAVTRLEELYSS